MRPQSAYSNRAPEIAPGEKIIAAASYLTTGIIGFLWVIISHVTGSKIKSFLRYHIYQSIFLAVLYYVFNLIMNILVGIVVKVPFIGSLVYSVYFYLFNFKIIMGYSIIDFVIFTAILYLVLTSLSGKISRLPWVSDVIKSML
jgi:hypothetical protein